MTATPERQTFSGADTLDSSPGKRDSFGVVSEPSARAGLSAQVVETGGTAQNKPVGVVFRRKHANCSGPLGMRRAS